MENQGKIVLSSMEGIFYDGQLFAFSKLEILTTTITDLL